MNHSSRSHSPSTMETPISNEGPLHSHCETCIKVNKCTARPHPGESCNIVTCNSDCGARFHACKMLEHKLLCMNEKVPCINSINGCPLLMPRSQLGRHLETCPASVVHCTMEWNRWPVCSGERLMHIPFRQPNPNVRLGQLDVALALRDQRMLNEWLRAPRKTRRALRNSLTRRFPAVPFQLRGVYESDSNENSSHTSRTVTDDEEDTPWEVRKTPPGLKRSVCGELYRASKQATESLSAALSIITNHVVMDGQEGSVEELAMDEDKENVVHSMSNGWSAEHHLQLVLNTPVDVMDTDHLSTIPIDSNIDKNRDDIVFSAQAEREPLRSYDVIFVNHTIISEISSASMTDHARKQPSPPPPPSSPPLFVNLGLDLTLESITRYQTKPKSMYTFLCAQEFRRDEYSWHYKNVHGDIHGGLNGWLEQRCPLAHYGCMYSLRRFYPNCQGSGIVHNQILESFGVLPFVPPPLGKPVVVEKKNFRRSPGRVEKSYPTNGTSIDAIPEEDVIDVVLSPTHSKSPKLPSLNQLPFEVLQHIARFLDSFSLCNLAMTSRILREVCCSLLEERGIVVQQWERHEIGRKHTWKIAYKRWFFSTAFTPVVWWGFEDKECMANHLKKCTYFNRNVKTDPYYYPMGTEPNPGLFEKLKLKPQQVQENQATKL